MANKPRTKMPTSERAKQFMPFAALKGLYEAFAEKERIRVDKVVLSDDMIDELNAKLQQVKVGKPISIIYYHDGEYLKQAGMVSKIDAINMFIQIVDNRINFDDLYQIEFE